MEHYGGVLGLRFFFKDEAAKATWGHVLILANILNQRPSKKTRLSNLKVFLIEPNF